MNRLKTKKVIILNVRTVFSDENHISFYPDSAQLIHSLYDAGYQVCLFKNNSSGEATNYRNLLHNERLFHLPVYEFTTIKAPDQLFLRVCENEKVMPDECYLIDDCSENCSAAEKLGMSIIQVARFNRGDFKEKLLTAGVLREQEIAFPENFNRGIYPSLFGLMHGNIVSYQPDCESVLQDKKPAHRIIITDQTNSDGNQQKRCLYESRLSKLIVEFGIDYWKPAYKKINSLFIADFDRKNNFTHESYYHYFLQIEKILKKENVLEDKEKVHTRLELRNALEKLFLKEPLDLATISQFYYGVWLLDYGHQPLEPFVFLVDAKPVLTGEQILILALFHDISCNAESRRNAYLLAQNWVTCGAPQLRGRQPRENAPKPANSNTIGIIRDDDPNAHLLQTSPHYAAKVGFAPFREHPVAQRLQSIGAPIIGGSSGTLGRNIYMLAPLVSSGLLTQKEIMQYVMGFAADLIYRGHHSYEEVAINAGKILFPLKPWLDPIRDPFGFYEQLLTPEFIASNEYMTFKAMHQDFFNEEIKPALEYS